MSPLLAFNRKLPSKSVMVPLVVPFTITLAPIIGSPVVSLTIPLTTICWANVLTDKNNPTMNISRTLNVAFLFMSLYINALILFILFGKIPIENYSTFLLAFL